MSYIYVLVRRDIPNPHRAVQAVHAAYAAGIAYPAKSLSHPNLVLCEVADEQSLKDEFERMKAKFVPCVAFREEDMQNEMTAVATGQIRGPERRKLRHLKLLRD